VTRTTAFPWARALRGAVQPALAMALLLALGASAHAAAPPSLKAGTFDPPRAAPDFTLDGSDAQALTLSRFRGKVVLLQFGFTTCPNVCPATLATLAQVRRALGEQASDVQVIFITVDPERDDAARLRRYLGQFDAGFIGGTGSEAALAAVRKAYGIAAQRSESGGTAQYGHSSFVTLIDRHGLLRAIMPFGYGPEAYVHDVRALLAP
jgi:protein SCO1